MTEPTTSAPISAPPIPTAPMLSVEDVTVSFDGFTILDSLDFGLEQRELRFIIGPNGAGETTLLDLITGKTKPDRGGITCNGDTDLTRRQEHDRVRLGIGRKFQTPSVFTSLTVYENLEVSVGFRSRLGRLFRSVSRQDRDWIKSAQEQVGLSERPMYLPASSPTARSSGWKLECCWPSNPGCCSVGRAHRGPPAVHRARD